MAATIQEDEAAPTAYPTVYCVSEEAKSLDPALIWQRIESYTSRRFSTRSVTWIVEGCGEWAPPLSPATLSTCEVWQNYAWVAFTPTPGPLGGYAFNGYGPYRITANVGAGPVPAAVKEAFVRLAEYFADVRESAVTRGTAGVVKNDLTIGQLTEMTMRSPTWSAKAMEASGAGDLLRPYRRT